MTAFFPKIRDDGGLSFERVKDRQAFQEFVKINKGKRLKITLDEKSVPMRRYFEGGIVPFFALQHMVDGAPMKYEDARNILKREFNAVFFQDLHGHTVQEGGSTKNFNRDEMSKFIDRCIRYMQENEMEIPDPEEYKRWEDTAPFHDEEYPPIARLRAQALEKMQK